MGRESGGKAQPSPPVNDSPPVRFQLPAGTIIQVWKDSTDNSEFGSWASYLNQAANEGYNVILSSPWYINYISYGKYNTDASVMNLEFFKYYEIEPLKQFSGEMRVGMIRVSMPMDWLTGSNEARERILGW